MTLHTVPLFFFIGGSILFLLAYFFKKKFVDGKGIGDSLFIWGAMIIIGVLFYIAALIGLIIIAFKTA